MERFEFDSKRVNVIEVLIDYRDFLLTLKEEEVDSCKLLSANDREEFLEIVQMVSNLITSYHIGEKYQLKLEDLASLLDRSRPGNEFLIEHERIVKAVLTRDFESLAIELG